MIALAKFLHIAAIAIWAAGVVSLPGLYVQRAHVKDEDALLRLQRLVRFAYIGIISPAAFVAVLTGTMLIFLRQTFEAWFSIKLALVGVFAILHVLTGLVVIRLFRDGEIYPPWRFVTATVLSGGVVVAIFFIVLAKPTVDLALIDVLSEPGGLKRLYDEFNPWGKP
ncbi:CopD family protein (plasmid) [Shinella sp. H4-D48]|uniref:CopD family protein n=1 Tax=Shinella sedimenti TaxID=2919913 RepID=A0ABT0CND9_9HYPH|nr:MULTISPECIES: CopD family protein [Shinella]MCJ8150122.1 CopD family protein [Shinella sedimenti]UNK40481.1 CopD family protein [Shinella sp. H4-D48]